MSKRDKEMRAEYDFSSGVRGKHAAKLKSGHTTIVTLKDGSSRSYTTRPIILDRELQAVFKTSKAVNKALRGLLELVPDR